MVLLNYFKLLNFKGGKPVPCSLFLSSYISISTLHFHHYEHMFPDYPLVYNTYFCQ